MQPKADFGTAKWKIKWQDELKGCEVIHLLQVQFN